MAFLALNHEQISARAHGVLVTVDNASLGRRVREGKHWSKKWRDNIDPEDFDVPQRRKQRVHGTLVGYVGNEGLVGENATHVFNLKHVKQWGVVLWDNGKTSVYPIGDEGIFALAYVPGKRYAGTGSE